LPQPHSPRLSTSAPPSPAQATTTGRSTAAWCANIAYELVAKPDTLTLYVSDHGKPVPTPGATAKAVIYAGSEKTAVKLEPAGDNRLSVKGAFKIGVGVRVIVTTTLPGKAPAKVTFNLK
jgi:hypothetical protein